MGAFQRQFRSSANLAKNIKLGMVEQAALGGRDPGGPCYGYRLEVLVVVGGNEVSIRRRNGERLSPDEPPVRTKCGI